MDFKYNDVLKRYYKNAEIEIVVEDDVITTAKVFIDNKCVSSKDIYMGGGMDMPYSREHLNAVVDSMKEEVDEMWEENFKLATANR